MPPHPEDICTRNGNGSGLGKEGPEVAPAVHHAHDLNGMDRTLVHIRNRFIEDYKWSLDEHARGLADFRMARAEARLFNEQAGFALNAFEVALRRLWLRPICT
jgi:hypothetical protein